MKRNKHQNINGWLILNKPKGISSNDAVVQTRRLFDANKNGHCGTLDPFAEGVLPIAFGEATKLISMIADGAKEYEFELKFGQQTDTLDTEGKIVATSDKIPSKEEIMQVIPQFIGIIEQTPPAYSAIKINGQRAYDLARKGVDVNIAPRKIEIFDLRLLEMPSADCVKFCVNCSKGTYIRVLGADIATKLGSVGYLTSLKRTKCANFSINDTILLEKLKNMVYESNRKDLLLSTEAPLRDIADFAVSEEDATKLRLGQKISPRNYALENLCGKKALAMSQNCLVAIVQVEEKRISPLRVFNL